jgi:hypothetical protein
MARSSRFQRDFRRGQRYARQVEHALKHPEKFADEMLLRQLPPYLRQIYRDLKHPPSPEQLLKRYLRLRRLEARAKAHIKRALANRPTAPEPDVPATGEARIIEIDGTTVRISG